MTDTARKCVCGSQHPVATPEWRKDLRALFLRGLGACALSTLHGMTTMEIEDELRTASKEAEAENETSEAQG